MKNVPATVSAELKILNYLDKINSKTREAVLKTFLLNEYYLLVNGMAVEIGKKNKKIFYRYFPELPEKGSEILLNESLFEARKHMADNYDFYLPSKLHLPLQAQFSLPGKPLVQMALFDFCFESAVENLNVTDHEMIHLPIDAFYDPIDKQIYASSRSPNALLETFMNSYFKLALNLKDYLKCEMLIRAGLRLEVLGGYWAMAEFFQKTNNEVEGIMMIQDWMKDLIKKGLPVRALSSSLERLRYQMK